MKAVGFNRPLPIEHPDALLDIELPEPDIGTQDILVEVKAVAINPADVKIRASHTPAAGQYRIPGWDAAGVVTRLGRDVKGFDLGDEVYFAGAINRPGAYAEYVAVDARIAAKKPRNLSFAEAAALPLTTLTAWETLFDRLDVHKPIAGDPRLLLLIGGAGGVGSMAIQLAKQLTDLTVIASAAREESRAWCKALGADIVINHHDNLAKQITSLQRGAPGFVFSTNHTESYLPQIAELIAAQGRLALIDDPESLDINIFKGKSISVHWEFMFTRPMHRTADMAAQGRILAESAALIEAGRLKSTLTRTFTGLNAANFRKAQAMVERGDMIGKIVIENS